MAASKAVITPIEKAHRLESDTLGAGTAQDTENPLRDNHQRPRQNLAHELPKVITRDEKVSPDLFCAKA
jgi:hypothetical protein